MYNAVLSQDASTHQKYPRAFVRRTDLDNVYVLGFYQSAMSFLFHFNGIIFFWTDVILLNCVFIYSVLEFRLPQAQNVEQADLITFGPISLNGFSFFIFFLLSFQLVFKWNKIKRRIKSISERRGPVYIIL